MRIDFNTILLAARAVFGSALRIGVNTTSGGLSVQTVVDDISDVVKGAKTPDATLLGSVAHVLDDLTAAGIVGGAVVTRASTDLSTANSIIKNVQNKQATILAADLNLFGVPGDDVYVPHDSDVYRFMTDGFITVPPTGAPISAAAPSSPQALAEAYYNLTQPQRDAFHQHLGELTDGTGTVLKGPIPPAAGTGAPSSAAQQQTSGATINPGSAVTLGRPTDADPRLGGAVPPPPGTMTGSPAVPTSDTLHQPNPEPGAVTSTDKPIPPQSTPVS